MSDFPRLALEVGRKRWSWVARILVSDPWRYAVAATATPKD